MPVVLSDVLEPAGWQDEWPRPARTHFISSNAFETFKRELYRYVREEVPGRSFLIAGHRGAGKTTMVQRALVEVAVELVEQTVKLAKAPTSGDDRRPTPQRPLLVKVHGPSLFTGELPDPEKEKADKAAANAAAAGGVQPPTSAGDGDTSQEEAAAAPASVPQGALVHLTIALYRALATEASSCFALHAREERELAGQLTLEFDSGPDTALLRGFWERIDRLDAGVFWPRPVGDKLVEWSVGAQGMREIVALATAAQAFQVCTGAVSYSTTSKEAAARESKLQTNLTFDLKDIANKAFGLAAGALVGAGALASDWTIVSATAAGAAVAAISTLTLSLTGERSRRSDRTTDYSFIKDRTTQTLDRDLPEVIRRIRAAGLAPVFVLDELDKVEKLEERITDLIERLKHLTTDYGFFCFLTDRKYYEYVRQITRSSAFPKEHTFFSNRLLILYQPPEIVGFLTRIVDATRLTDSADGLARQMLGRLVPLRAKLNTIDVMRGLAQLSDSSGTIREASSLWTSDIGYQLAVAVQIAVELVLNERELKARIEEEPVIAQLAIDAAYYIVRGWESEADPIDLSRVAVVRYMLQRMSIDVPTSGDPEDALPVNAAPLIRAVDEMASLLGDFNELQKRALSAYVDPDTQALIAVIPATCQRLLETVDADAQTYRFTYDIYGNALDLKNLDALNASSAEVEKLAAFAQSLEETLTSISSSVEELVARDVLPATIAWNTVGDARRKLLRAVRQRRPYDGFASELPKLRAAMQIITEEAPNIAVIVKLALYVAHDAGAADKPLPVSTALAAVGHHVRLAEYCRVRRAGVADAVSALAQHVALPKSFTAEHVPGAETTQDWRGELETLGGYRSNPLAELRQLQEAAWAEWLRPIGMFALASRDAAPQPVGYGNLVLAARALPPGNVLKQDLATLSIADWSRVCLLVLQPSADQTRPPREILVAALHVLGFGKAALMAAATESLPEEEVTSTGMPGTVGGLAAQILEIARPDRDGTVLVMLDDNSLANLPPAPETPIFALRREEEDIYKPALDWLATNLSLTGVFDERHEVSEKQSPA